MKEYIWVKPKRRACQNRDVQNATRF
jgi:hypothetical protein